MPLESTALSLAKTILQKAAAAWIADRRTAEERKKELRALLTPRFRRESPEQRFLDEAASELASLGHEFRGLDDGDRAAALLAVGDIFKRADLTDRMLFSVDVDAAKLASRLRAGQPRAKTAAGLGEVGGAFYDTSLDRCCELYVRAVVQVPAFVGRSSAEILSRLSDLPDQVADRVVNALGEAQAAVADPDGGLTVAGRPLEEVTDPFVLEVHRPVQPEDAPPGLPVLPLYVPREHDQVLGQVVRAAAEGRSGIAVLVGGSSTGKTRACWEALALLRDRDPSWRLWHPIDPSRPDAALAELAGIGRRTVVWLNEAQFYLGPTEGGLGERVAAGLREVLRDPGRAPVLVLATLWPRFWDVLTARPASGEDRHTQARELLAAHDIAVPAAFTPTQMGQLARAVDVRIVLAAKSAPDGEVIQFLAGAPELLARYRNAPPAAAALIDAAMDARRLGMGVALPQAFLEAAAPGYLTDAQWDGLGEDWLEQALAYAVVPCKGARGPLTRIRPRPAGHAARGRGDQPASTAVGAELVYRLADYLDQHGRAHRASQIPPAEFWSAAAYTLPGDQAALGDAASARGLYRDATQLHKNAAAAGDLSAAFFLSRDLPDCLSTDPRPAHWAAVHVALDDPDAVADLLEYLREVGAHELRAALLARDPAAHATLNDPQAVTRLLGSLLEAHAREQVAALASRAAAHAPLDDPEAVADLLDYLWEVGAPDQAAALLACDPAAYAALDNPGSVAWLLAVLQRDAHEHAVMLADRAAAHAPLDDPAAVARLLGVLQADAPEQAAALLACDPAAQVTLDDPGSVARLLDILREAGAHEQTAALARRAAAHAPLDNPYRVARLLDSLREAGAHEQAVMLADRAAANSTLNYPDVVADLLDSLRRAGAHEQAAALAARAAAEASLDDPDGVARLLGVLQEAGAHEHAAALAARAAAEASLDDPDGVARLLGVLQEAGAHEQAVMLTDRAAANAPLDDPAAVANLLDALRRAGTPEQAAALLARDPAAHVTLDDPGSVASLLISLREAGAHEQAAALLARDPAAHVTLDSWRGVANLLYALQEGAPEQAAGLTCRLPAAGMFDLFLSEQGPADQFRFGREADGTPATPWGWEDLDLWLAPQHSSRYRNLLNIAPGTETEELT